MLKLLGTWAKRHDSVSYVINLLPAMTVVLCAAIWIVCRWRPQSGTMLTAAGCGRATLTPRPGGLANRARRELCRSILWTNRDVEWTIGWWRQSLFPGGIGSVGNFASTFAPHPGSIDVASQTSAHGIGEDATTIAI